MKWRLQSMPGGGSRPISTSQVPAPAVNSKVNETQPQKVDEEVEFRRALLIGGTIWLIIGTVGAIVGSDGAALSSSQNNLTPAGTLSDVDFRPVQQRAALCCVARRTRVVAAVS